MKIDTIETWLPTEIGWELGRMDREESDTSLQMTFCIVLTFQIELFYIFQKLNKSARTTNKQKENISRNNLTFIKLIPNSHKRKTEQLIQKTFEHNILSIYLQPKDKKTAMKF